MCSKHVAFYSVTILFKTNTFILERIFAARHSMRTSVSFVFFSALLFDWVHWVHWIKYVCVGTRSRKDKKKQRVWHWYDGVVAKSGNVFTSKPINTPKVSVNTRKAFNKTSVTLQLRPTALVRTKVSFVSCLLWISIGRVSQYWTELIVNTRFRFATCVDVIGLSQVHAPYTLFSSFDGPQT